MMRQPNLFIVNIYIYIINKTFSSSVTGEYYRTGCTIVRLSPISNCADYVNYSIHNPLLLKINNNHASCS